jgi:hypothetical protein
MADSYRPRLSFALARLHSRKTEDISVMHMLSVSQSFSPVYKVEYN